MPPPRPQPGAPLDIALVRAMGAAGSGASGVTDLALRHDDYLVEIRNAHMPDIDPKRLVDGSPRESST